MIYQLSAACGCKTGRIRGSNEDNLYFSGKILSEENSGMKGVLPSKSLLTDLTCFAVFDGMGGAACGEAASFQAAETFRRHIEDHLSVAESPRGFLEAVCEEMNLAVCSRAQELCASTMGTTAVILAFVPDQVYVCNLGDSRAYRLRSNELMQMTVDDWEVLPPHVKRKPGLSQCLGISPEDMLLEPHIAKCEILPGDTYLLCSDGITDMLTNIEIYTCLKAHISPQKSVEHLLKLAMDHGGRDNATAIVIKVI